MVTRPWPGRGSQHGRSTRPSSGRVADRARLRARLAWQMANPDRHITAQQKSVVARVRAQIARLIDLFFDGYETDSFWNGLTGALSSLPQTTDEPSGAEAGKSLPSADSADRR
jgi:hypothetical protein